MTYSCINFRHEWPNRDSLREQKCCDKESYVPKFTLFNFFLHALHKMLENDLIVLLLSFLHIEQNGFDKCTTPAVSQSLCNIQCSDQVAAHTLRQNLILTLHHLALWKLLFMYSACTLLTLTILYILWYMANYNATKVNGKHH